MGATGRLWLLVILVLGSNLSNHEGTILASTSSLEKTESQGLPSETVGCSGTQGQELEGHNSLYCCTPRIYSAEKHPEDGSPRMELSVPGNRCEEQREQILLQQLRESLQHREVVAADKVVEDKVEQPTAEREKAQGSTEWQGAGDHLVGTLWYRRTIGNDTVGGDDSYQKRAGLNAASEAGRDGNDWPSGREGEDGEERGHGEDRDLEEIVGTAWSERRSHLSTDREGGAGHEGDHAATSSAYPQGSAPTTADRKTNAGSTDPGERVRHQMATMERVHEDEIHRAGKPLQEQEEGTQDPPFGAQGQVGCTSFGSQARSQRGRAQGCGVPFPGSRRSNLRRRPDDFQLGRRGDRQDGQQQAGEETGCKNRTNGIPCQSRQEDSGNVTFEDKVKVTVLDDANGDSYDFIVNMGSFDDWDSKPWSLYGGAFTSRAQERMIRIATTLHHGGPGCEDVQGRGGEGAAHCLPRGDDHLQLHRGEGHGHGDRGERDDGEERVQDGESGQGEHTTATVHTFGLFGGYLGMRSKKVRTSTLEDEGELREVVRTLWTGFADDYMDLVSPEPQPPPMQQNMGTSIEKFLVVDFLHPDDPMHIDKCPILCDVYGWREGGTTRRIFASMAEIGNSWHGLIRDLALDSTCHSRHGNQCLLRIGMELQIAEELRPLSTSELVTINYDQPEEVEEWVSLMQHAGMRRHAGMSEQETGETGATSHQVGGGEAPQPGGRRDRAQPSTIDEAFIRLQIARGVDEAQASQGGRIVYHMFHRSVDFKSEPILARNPFEEREQVAQAWGVPTDQIRGIYPIRDRPEDFPVDGSLLVITKWARDDEVRSFEEDVLVLIDVEIHSGSGGDPSTRLFRKVTWARDRMTRTGVLMSIWVHDFCRIRADDRCLVWKNNALWPIQQLEEQTLRNGDYLRIAVPAEDGQTTRSTCRILLRAERAARYQSTFHSSGSSDTSQEEEEEEEGSDTEYGRPPSLPEPEPHDNLDIQHQPDSLQELCDRISGSPEHRPWIYFHGLSGGTAGTATHKCTNVPTVETILRIAGAKWPPKRNWTRRIIVVDPQPCQCQGPAFDLHIIVEYQPCGWAVLCNPALFQTVKDGGSRLEFTYKAGYDEHKGKEGTLRTDYTANNGSHRALQPTCRLHIFTPRLFDTEPRTRTLVLPKEAVGQERFVTFCCRFVFPELAEYSLETTDEITGEDTIYILAKPPGQKTVLCVTHHDEKGEVTSYHAEVAEHVADNRIHIWQQGGSGQRVPDRTAKPYGLGWEDVEDLPNQPFDNLQRRAIPINLASCLDGEQYQPKKQDVDGDQDRGMDFRPVFDLWAWLDASYPMVQWSLPEEAKWHWATESWTHDWWDLHRADEIYVYTDGSANKTTSAAAAVFFVRTSHRWFYAGYLRQDLNGHPCAHRAELHGILLGYHWINATLHRLACTQTICPKVTFAFDATSAGYKAFGQWGGGRYEALVSTLRSLCYFLEARYGIHIGYEHVYGHQDHPGNEAANTIAQLRQNGGNSFPSVWAKYFDTSVAWEVHWLWAIWKAEWKDFWTNGFLILPEGPSSTPSANLFDSQAAESLEPSKECPTTVDLRCKVATANVLTLLPSANHGGLQGRARTELLQNLFYQQGYNIVGLQETRQRKEGKVEQQDYLVFSAAANAKGQYGIQIWISRTLPLGHEKAYLEKHHFKIVARSPRSLILRMAAPFIRALIVCAHAPTSQNGEDEISGWWANLRKAVPAKYSQWPQILLVDANARLGSQLSDAVGGHQAEEQDHGGQEIQAYLKHFALWIPSTFYEHQKGQGGTWKHPRTGAWLRGDYVGLPKDWQLTRCEANIDMEIDLSLKREDHRVAGVTFGWVGQPARGEDCSLRRQAPIAVDILRDHLQGPERNETMADLLRYVPVVPWATDVHTHTDLLQNGLQRWLWRHYIRGPRRPKRRLSKPTWDLVCAKKDHRNELFRHQRLLQQRTLRACWSRWTGKTEDDVIETVEEARAYATTLKAFRALGGQVTYALRKDDRDFFEEMAKETGEMDEPSRCREFWRRIRGAFPKFKEKAKNSPLSLDVLDAQWMPHFARLEAGSEVTPGNLLTQCVQRQERQEKETIALESMPTRHDVEMILRSLQSNKAAGPDGIPGDLYKNAAAGLAEHIHSLWSKITYWCAEPVQAKGGLMVPILKKGDPGLAGSYRGVMLLSVLAN